MNTSTSSGMFDEEYLTLERAMHGDSIFVKWREIRAITGTLHQDNPQSPPEIIEGACTLYLEGELGFIVNHTADHVAAMIRERQTKQ